jgi:glucose-6-phosphate isomerase
MVIDLSDISGLPIQLQETTCDGQKVWKLTGDIVPKPGKRILDEIRPVLLDKSISEPNILYYMYRDVKCTENVEVIKRWGLRYDISIFFPYKLGKEYMKTSGHYHPYVCDNRLISFPEVYEVIHGEALFLLQKPNNVWGDKGEVQIEDAIALIVKQGQKVIMPPNYGHIAINRSTKEPLVTSNWVAAAFSSTYWSIERHKGGAYYFIAGEDGKTVTKPNDCYTTGNHWLPPLRWFEVKNLPQFGLIALHEVSAERSEQEKPMYKAFLENPHHFMFLRYPQRFMDALQPDNLFVPCA